MTVTWTSFESPEREREGSKPYLQPENRLLSENFMVRRAMILRNFAA
jgi:hypothetical protein